MSTRISNTTGTARRLSTNVSQPRATPKSSFGSLVRSHHLAYLKSALRTAGLSERGAEQMLGGKELTDPVDKSIVRAAKLGKTAMSNFDIQDLMSRYNQSEALASSVQKKKDDTAGAVIGKI